MITDSSLIYVDIDALFDTRLSTLYMLDKEKTNNLLRGDFFSRKHDDFEDYDLSLYKKRYAERNIETIKNAVITNVPMLILFFAEQTLKARSGTPFIKQPKLHLNIHPYKLPEQAIKAIVEGLRIVTKELIDIEVINVPISELPPKYVKETYATMVMYAYWEWLEYHAEQKNFEGAFCPEITLIGPAIVRSKEAWGEVQAVDIFQVIEQYSSMFIKLTLYPVSTFCVDLERLATTGR